MIVAIRRHAYLLITILLIALSVLLLRSVSKVDSFDRFIDLGVGVNPPPGAHESPVRLVIESRPPGIRLRLFYDRTTKGHVAISIAAGDNNVTCSEESDGGVNLSRIPPSRAVQRSEVQYHAEIDPAHADTEPGIDCDVAGDVVEQRSYAARSVIFGLGKKSLPGTTISRIPIDLGLFAAYHPSGDLRVDGGEADANSSKKRILTIAGDPVEIAWTDLNLATQRDALLVIIGTLTGAAASTLLEWLRPFISGTKQ